MTRATTRNGGVTFRQLLSVRDPTLSSPDTTWTSFGILLLTSIDDKLGPASELEGSHPASASSDNNRTFRMSRHPLTIIPAADPDMSRTGTQASMNAKVLRGTPPPGESHGQSDRVGPVVFVGGRPRNSHSHAANIPRTVQLSHEFGPGAWAADMAGWRSKWWTRYPQRRRRGPPFHSATVLR